MKFILVHHTTTVMNRGVGFTKIRLLCFISLLSVDVTSSHQLAFLKSDRDGLGSQKYNNFVPIHGHARMIDEALLKILRCPKDLSPLSLAKPWLLEHLNRAIASKLIVNIEGERVEKPLKNGVFSESSGLLYPIINQIPALLPGEAIPLNQLGPLDQLLKTNREKTDA